MEKGIDSYLRFLKGESSAMRTIVELYWDNMLWFTNQYVHNLTDAEDIAQEALVRLAMHRPKLQEEHQLKAYLLRICRNLAYNHKKRQKLMVTDKELELMTDETVQIEERMELSDASRMLHRSIAKLKQEYREVIYLRYFSSLSVKETAKIMHCSEKQVTALAYQARQLLKSMMEKEGYTSEEL